MTKKTLHTDVEDILHKSLGYSKIPNGGFVPLKKITKLIKSYDTNIKKKNNIIDIFNKKKDKFISVKDDLNVIDEL
jgi:hypothetical protein